MFFVLSCSAVSNCERESKDNEDDPKHKVVEEAELNALIHHFNETSIIEDENVEKSTQDVNLKTNANEPTKQRAQTYFLSPHGEPIAFRTRARTGHNQHPPPSFYDPSPTCHVCQEHTLDLLECGHKVCHHCHDRMRKSIHCMNICPVCKFRL